MGVELIYLSQEDVLATNVGMKEILHEVEKMFGNYDRGEVNLPSKVILDLGEFERGRINAMPAYIGGDYNICGIKWIGGFPGNPRKYNLPRASALIILNDADNGFPLAVMDGTYISAMRTGASTGVGAKYLARQDSASVCMIGCGPQAQTQIMALQQVLPHLEDVRLYDLSREIAETLAELVENKFKLKALVVNSAEEAVRGADVIVTATVADEPIVKDEWLKDGYFFSHVGSFQEEEELVVQNADKIIPDVWEEVLHRRTPLIARMYLEGTLKKEKIYADIGALVNGKKPGRESDRERIYYSPIGVGSADVAVAYRVYQKAKEMELGKTIKLWDKPIFGGGLK